MYRVSDSDSVDSDKGIRYKTDSIRNKDKASKRDSSSRRDRREKRRSRSRSPRHRENKRKKLKKRRREHSSEDERSGSRHRDGKKDGKTRKQNISSSQSSESPKIESKLNNSLTINQSCVIGPALPPHLLKKNSVDSIETIEPSLSRKPKLKIDDNFNPSQKETSFSHNPTPTQLSDDPINPLSPSEIQSKVIGPILPPDFNKKLPENETEISKESYNAIGSNITPPPDLTPPKQTNDEKNPESKVIGPALPPGFKPKPTEPHQDDPQLPDEPIDKVMGPSLPPDLRRRLVEASTGLDDSSEEEEVYGPVPVGDSFSKAHMELEERALKIKIDQLDPEGDRQATREEWMLTLPEAKASKFGLGPRSFRAKAGPDLSDRSSWTDTPEDKVKKKLGKAEPKIDLQKEAELREIRKRDKEQEAIAKKSKKHKESLLDIHQKKFSKDKSESGPSERRPFSRDIDLQVNRFDEAQKKAVLKKAQLLDGRFSSGESKYL